MKRIQHFWPLAALFFYILWAFAPVAFLEHPLKFDLITTAYPWRYFIGECLQNFRLPLWNPYQNLGYPIHADPQSGAWHPIAWLIGFFRGYDIYSISWEFLLHLFLAGVGMQMLAKRLQLTKEIGFLASVAYISSGFFVGNAQHLPWIISATWIPFILAMYLDLMEKPGLRVAILLGLFIFLLLSGGYPAFMIVLIYLLLILFCYRFYQLYFSRKEKKKAVQFLRYNLIAVLAAALFSAVVLVSVYEALPFISRGAGVKLLTALIGPFSPQSFLSFVFPYSVVKETAFFKTDLSMSNAYIGIVLLIFLLYVLFKKKPALFNIFLAWGGFCLLAAMGEYLPVRQWLYDYVPLMNLFRMPALFRLFTILGIILTGAYGLQAWLNKEHEREALLRTLLLFFFLIPALIASLFYVSFHTEILRMIRTDLFHETAFTNIYDHLVVQGFMQAGFALLLLLAITVLKKKNQLSLGIGLVLILDMGLSTRLNAPYTLYDESTNSWTLHQIDKGFNQGFPKPMMMAVGFNSDKLSRHHVFYNNVNCFRKQFGWDGYNPFNLQAYDDLVFSHHNLFIKTINNPPIYLSDAISFSESLAVTPPTDTTETRTLYFELSTDIDMLRTQLSTANLKLHPGDTAFFTSFAPDNINIQTHTKESAMLSLLQNHYPGWELSIDGKPENIYTSNLCFMSAYLSPGSHQLEFRYRPWFVIFAGWISLLSIMAAFLYFLTVFIRRPHETRVFQAASRQKL